MNKYKVSMTLQSPLSHNDEQALSTTTPFRKMKIMVDGEPMDVPVYTGNAFRGKLRREAAKDFVMKLGIKELSDRQYHILYAGGMLDKGATGDVMVAQRREYRKHIPYISLFGGSIGTAVIEGRLEVGMLYPICKETSKYTGEESDKSCYELLQPIFYTHREEREDLEDPTIQMKYEVECLIPGTKLVTSIIVKTDNELELSVFGATIRRWLKMPMIGGKSAVGHGLVDVHIQPELPGAELYYEYLAEHKEEMLKFIAGI